MLNRHAEAEVHAYVDHCNFYKLSPNTVFLAKLVYWPTN